MKNPFDTYKPDQDPEDSDMPDHDYDCHHHPCQGGFHGPPRFGGPFGPDEWPGAWFGPPGPPYHYGQHHHGPPGQGLSQGPPPAWPFGPQSSPSLLSKEAFQEIKHLFLLMIIQDAPDGLTGYQLQEKYSIARGNLIRALDELEAKEYLTTRETVENGRNQKYYTITDKGKAYVDQLKEDWANRFAMLSEIAPPDIHGNPFLREGPNRRMMKDIDRFTSKEDAIDYFHGIRSMLKSFLLRAQERVKRTENAKTTIDSIIEKIDQMEEFNLDEIKAMIKQATQDIREKSE